jgi:hypothetical protein
VRGANKLSYAAGQALTRALVGLSALVLPARRPALVPIRVHSDEAAWSRANLRRGPPTCN